MDWIDRRIRETLDSIPGYQGYRSLENRRDDDRRVRDTIANEIASSADQLTRVGAQLAEQRKLQQISAIERLVGETRHLSNRVRSASYGYGGLFSARDVGADVLEQLRLFDEFFLTDAARLKDLVGKVTVGEDGVSPEALSAFGSEIVKLNTLFDARTQVVDTAQPSKDAEVLALIDPEAPIIMSPVVALTRNDTLSVLGENYVVDAVVRIGKGKDAVGMARVGKDADGNPLWLIGGNTDAFSTMMASQSTGTAPSGSVAKRAEATIQTADESRSNVVVQYGAGGVSGADASFWYTIGNETRVFTGSTVVDDDIEIYGQS